MIFLVVIISIGGVNAQPPFQVSPTLIEGYSIEIPEQGILKLNDNYTFFFHVFNLSTGLPLSSSDGVVCEFNLHNSSSTTIFSDTDLSFSPVTTAFFTPMLGSNFSSTGIYTYVTHCNSTAFGGGSFC